MTILERRIYGEKYLMIQMLRELCDAIWNTYGQLHDKDIPKLSILNYRYETEVKQSFYHLQKVLVSKGYSLGF